MPVTSGAPKENHPPDGLVLDELDDEVGKRGALGEKSSEGLGKKSSEGLGGKSSKGLRGGSSLWCES